MFDFSGQSQAIVDELAANGNFRTVAFIEDDRDSAEQMPRTLPAAFLALEKREPREGKPTSEVIVDIVWAVVVRSKALMGPSGCLALIDVVDDILTGFKPPGEVKPLRLGVAEFYDRSNESVAYIIRFASMAAGKSNNVLCGR